MLLFLSASELIVINTPVPLKTQLFFFLFIRYFTHTTMPSKIQPFLQKYNHTFKNRLSIHRQKISTMFCNVSGPFPKMVTLPLLTFGGKNDDEKVHSTVGYNRERQRRCHNIQGRKPNHLSKCFIDFPQLTAFQ